jgi:ferrous iron transport protein A
VTDFQLSTLAIGAKAYVTRLSDNCSLSFKKKLLAMGFVAYTPVQIIRIAPLGCPLEIEIAQARISLRKNEAAHIYVKTQHIEDKYVC